MMIYTGDCLEVMKNIPVASIDMIYLDPPFYTQKTQILHNAKGKEYEFSDVWESKEHYLDYISERLKIAKTLLKDTGTIFLHCDNTASHYLKIVMDKIFDEQNFRSEIIWTYKRWSNSKKGLLPSHQVILFYSKTDKFKFNTLYNDYSPTTNIDQILQERERNNIGKTIYKRDTSGNIISSAEKKGVPLSDVWEIPFLNPKAKERTGYPTQKPIELLDRIIKISTDVNDIVLDPFCGSGTTLVSASLLNRNYIGIDINAEAVALAKSRLITPFKTSSSLLKKGASAYKTKTATELAILNQFDCNVVQRNKGIDAFLKKHYAGAPVAIKIQKDTETFEEALSLLNNASLKKNCRYSVLITDKKDFNELEIPNNIIILNSYAIQLEEKLMTLQ